MTLSANSILLILLFISSLSSQAQLTKNIPALVSGQKILPVQNSTIGGQAIEAFWLEPESYEVPQYEKVEWCVVLPERLTMAINEFFKKNGAGKNGINPYDPEQIDVWAEIWTPNSSQPLRVNGFFYQAIERDTKGDINRWTWNDLTTPHPFRLRFAPRHAGLHHVKIFISTPNKGKWESRPFSIESTAQPTHPGFIEISPNHRYYQYNNGEPFFPIGQNLLTASSCACELKSNSDPAGWLNTDCSTCFLQASDDPCCGLQSDQRQSYWRPPTAVVKNKLEHPAAFIKTLENLETLKDYGATAFRTILTPISYDFEFEKLNNYQDRQCMAWELDQLIEKADDLQLKIELCMLLHMPFTHTFSASWDWSDLDRWNDGFGGYCYYTEREKTHCDLEPASFFAQDEAKKYYQKKLRYFFARYGYSDALLQLELLSEANNVGEREKSNSPDDWWGWINSQLPESRSYNLNAQTRYDVGQWSDQMGRYIKHDLQQQHLIACSYTGNAMFSYVFDNPGLNCDDPLLDIAQMSPHIDIIAHSSYDSAFDRWKKWATHESPLSSDWYRLQCPPANKAGKRSYRGYPSLDRPVMHSENGNDLTVNTDQQWFEKDMWCNLFSGYASAGMAWGMMHPHPRWKMFAQVNQYMHKVILPMADLLHDSTWTVGWSEGRGQKDEARRMEIVYMKNHAPGKQCAFGILMNRTWNPAAAPPIDLDKDRQKSFVETWTPVFKEGVDQVSFMPFVEIPYKYSISPTIGDMGICNSFEITYYNPYTLQIIHRSDDDVILGKGVRLKEFPDLTFDLPYVLFTVVRNGNCIEK